MIEVIWTKPAEKDLENILAYVAGESLQGANTIASRIEKTVSVISRFPLGARPDRETGSYERVVSGLPYLLIYDLVEVPGDGLRAEVLAVFHTSRSPEKKPRRDKKR